MLKYFAAIGAVSAQLPGRFVLHKEFMWCWHDEMLYPPVNWATPAVCEAIIAEKRPEVIWFTFDHLKKACFACNGKGNDESRKAYNIYQRINVGKAEESYNELQDLLVV